MLSLNPKNVLGSFLEPKPKSGRLTRLAVWCLVLLTIVATACAWTVVYFVPHSNAFANAENDLARVEVQLARARKNATILKESPKNPSTPPLLLSRDMYRSFIETLGSVLKSHTLVLHDATPKAVISSLAGADRFPYSMATFVARFEGAKENILAFLEQIEREWSYASITKLDLRPVTSANSPPGAWLLELKIGFLVEPQGNR